MGFTCQWCGLESDDSAVCSWCGRDIRAVSSASSAPPPDPDAQLQGADDDDGPLTFIAPLGVRIELFAATALPFIAVAMAISRFLPVRFETLAAAVSFGCCFLLSTYQLLESVDERFAPVGVAGPLAVMFGPLAAAGVFVAIWLMTHRPEAGTVLGLVAGHMFAVLAAAYSRVPELPVAMRLAGWTTPAELVNLTFLAGVAGWALANFWRPLNE